MIEIDPVKLTADLIKCPSVTPDEGGAIALIAVSYTHLTLPTIYSV